jgi:DNA-binding XRE family transcriptional regulator
VVNYFLRIAVLLLLSVGTTVALGGTGENEPVIPQQCAKIFLHVQAASKFTSFGDWLKKSRENAGESQVELAEAVGLDHTYISKLEADKKEPSLRTIRTLASHFGVSPALPLIVIARQYGTDAP